MDDAAAFEYYDDPAKREPAPSPSRRRPQGPLTQHVPVRFPAETIEQVKRRADVDGMTVSAGIRRAVERALSQDGSADIEQIDGGDTRAVVERLQRDVAELVAALTRSDSRR
jgi:hypothetical protein